MTDRVHFDGVLIVGAGLAGLTAALSAAPRPVMVLAASPLGQGSSSGWAQGGMAAALGEDDDPVLHAEDTLAAGAGLCVPDAVGVLTREGPAAVRVLAALGAPFDRHNDGAFQQSLEAAHSRARVTRVGGDGAGAAIMRAVIAAVRLSENIDVREGWRVLSLLTDAHGRVRGALAESAGRLIEIVAPVTVMATGGLGGLYSVTTNPAAVRGEGMALAANIGARIVDPEFVQFHPTAIDIGADPAPLATEALRGDGARLIGADGEAFMARYHPAADLAPRDIVARAIAIERGAGRGAFLDAREAVGAAFPDHFPAVFSSCMEHGLDPRTQPIPIMPAAHYHMGGIATDLAGQSSVERLFAVGECAWTGVHGANRLASNSLLEASVFGARTGAAARDVSGIATSPLIARAAPDLPADTLAELRSRMSRYAGVVRDRAGLSGLIGWIDTKRERHGPSLALGAARLVASAALDRRESRGGHYRSDFPNTSEPAVHTSIVQPTGLSGDAQDFRVAAA